MGQVAMAVVTMLCGKEGSGKSAYARQLKKQHNAMILSCDEMMLSLFDEYLGEDHARVYDRCCKYLYRLAEDLAAAGVDVVLDFGFWSRRQRKEVRAAFKQKGIQTRLCHVTANQDVISQRLAKRNAALGEGTEKAYNIDEGMRALFDARFEEPGPEEVDALVDTTDGD